MKRTLILMYTLAFFACNSDSPTTPVNAGEIALVNAFPNLSFTSPVFLTHSNDGSNRIFVVEQPGVIRVFDNDSTANSTSIFLDIRSRVDDSGNEMGLLGLAFHPDFASNGFLFVNYTTSSDGPRRSVISRFSSDGNQADANSELVLIEVNQPFTNHNGGMLAFGTDGHLYISLGDGGSGGDPQNNAQNLSTLLGKILRIDIDNTDPGLNYAIPPDNPFANANDDTRKEIFAYGLRNPWRFSIDAQTSQVWCGDVGQRDWEEIDLIENGGNYGWRIMEGTHCFNPPSNCDMTGLILPVKEYGHTNGRCSVTGGYVYRGDRRPELRGAYIYGDFCSGDIWMLRYDNGAVTADSLLLRADASIASFGIDEQNELYLVGLGGNIFRFNRSAVTSVAESEVTPETFALAQNYPNPFNPSTRIDYSVSQAGFFELSIFNSVGQRIRTLLQKRLAPGAYSAAWDGKDDDGQKVSSGVYHYQLRHGNEVVQTRRMLMLK